MRRKLRERMDPSQAFWGGLVTVQVAAALDTLVVHSAWMLVPVLGGMYAALWGMQRLYPRDRS